MKRLLIFALILITLCLTMTGCLGKNYPGNAKSKYWLSSDNTMIFWFPAEAGHGKAEGDLKLNNGETISLILEWNTKNGIVEVKTAGYEKIFTAETTTNHDNLTCTFKVTSVEEGYSIPSEITFHWHQNREKWDNP